MSEDLLATFVIDTTQVEDELDPIVDDLGWMAPANDAFPDFDLLKHLADQANLEHRSILSENPNG